MAFWLFIALNATLFLRPAELVPALMALPIYQAIIIACAISALPQILRQLDFSRLPSRPITACVLAMMAAIALSHLSHSFFWGARHYSLEFGKTVLYYLIFVGVVTTSRRLEQFFVALLLLLLAMALLSALQYHGLIYLPQLDTLTQRSVDAVTGELTTITRLQSTGIFNDPNDFGMILVIGLVLCAHGFSRPGVVAKAVCLAMAGMFLYLLFLTKSRGAALAFLAAIAALAYAHWKGRRALYAALLVAPLVAAVFGARQDGGLEDGTGQSRIQLWSEGMGLLQQYPLFGLGSDLLTDEIGHVAHNSFVHCYAELGFFGGTIFFGCFYFAFMLMWRQVRNPAVASHPELKRRTATAFAMLCGTAVAMLTLSRSYVVPPYMVLGIVSVTAQLNNRRVMLSMPRLNLPITQRLATASAAFVITTYLFVRVMVRWS